MAPVKIKNTHAAFIGLLAGFAVALAFEYI